MLLFLLWRWLDFNAKVLAFAYVHRKQGLTWNTQNFRHRKADQQ